MYKLFESKQAQQSWVWITTMMMITSIHHIFRMGYGLVIPSIILTFLPYALMRWYASTKNTAVMKAYSFYSVLMFIWFGFMDGVLDHVLKVLGLQNLTFLAGGEAEVVQTALSLWSPQAGNIFYEETGVLTAIAGFIAMYYLVRMIQVKHTADNANQLTAVT
jgi:hypothetical protein